ncbi:hypothetical protein R6Q57_023323 [Mikania cordata]
MSYYSKSKTELAKIGAEGFSLLDDFNGKHKSNPMFSLSTSSAPPNHIPEVFHYQHQPQPLQGKSPIATTKVVAIASNCRRNRL